MRALTDLGWVIRTEGYEEAIALHQEALLLSEELEDSLTQITALSRMSMIYLNRLQLDHGLGLAQRALAIARTAGHDQELGTALDCLKLAALQLGDLELLDRTVAEIVTVQERAKDFYFIQWAYLEGAMAPLARGRPRAGPGPDRQGDRDQRSFHHGSDHQVDDPRVAILDPPRLR